MEKRTCVQCGQDFELSQGEISFYKAKGFRLPKRCKTCRKKNKQQADAVQGKPTSPQKPLVQHNSTSPQKPPVPQKPTPSSKKPKTTIATISRALMMLAIAVTAFFFLEGTGLLGNPQVDETGHPIGGTDQQQAGSDLWDWLDFSKLPKLDETGTVLSSQAPAPSQSAAPSAAPAVESSQAATNQNITYAFRSQSLLQQHFEKHGSEFTYFSAAEYERGANAVIHSAEALYKTEKEDGDGIYYLEKTNEFVVLSTDGYIRTYFRPSDGLDYFHRQ